MEEDSNIGRDLNRRTVLKGVTAASVTIGGFTQVGTAQAADKNGQKYCHEAPDGYSRCDPKFEPGTRVEVDGPSSGSTAGTWDQCCMLEDCTWWKFWSPWHDGCTDMCDEDGWRNDGETGTVRGTCEHSGSVLVEWDDGKESHIAEFTLSET